MLLLYVTYAIVMLRRMHLELRAKQLSPSLFAACMLSCFAPICVMHHTIIPCNTTPCGLRTPLWKACKSCLSRVVCSHHVCCLPDTIPVCVYLSPVSIADCWKMHVMCSQVSPCLSSQQIQRFVIVQ